METAKLIASLLIPVSIAFVGWILQRSLAEQARNWTAEDRLTDKRVAIYEKIGEDLNRIYCYVMDVGDFKGETPEGILTAKRNVDRAMFIYEAIWPEPTFVQFKDYMESSFDHYQGVGEDAKIRAKSFEKKAALKKRGEQWPDKWSDRFTEERDPEHKAKYQQLMKSISRDLKQSVAPVTTPTKLQSSQHVS